MTKKSSLNIKSKKQKKKKKKKKKKKSFGKNIQVKFSLVKQVLLIPKLSPKHYEDRIELPALACGFSMSFFRSFDNGQGWFYRLLTSPLILQQYLIFNKKTIMRISTHYENMPIQIY